MISSMMLMSKMVPISNRMISSSTSTSTLRLSAAKRRSFLVHNNDNTTLFSTTTTTTTTTTTSSSVPDDSTANTSTTTAATDVNAAVDDDMANWYFYKKYKKKVYNTKSPQYKPRYFKNPKPLRNVRAANIINTSIKVGKAPKSIKLIADDGFYDRTKQNSPAVIRQTGCTRHLFILKHTFTGYEMEAIAFRLSALTKNTAINSVIISTVEDNNDHVLSSSLFNSVARYTINQPMNTYLMQTSDYMSGTKNVAIDTTNPLNHYYPPSTTNNSNSKEALWDAIGAGYDCIKDLYKTGFYKDYKKTFQYMGYVQDLAIAGRGCHKDTKVPTISICDGTIVDSGYGLWLSGSYAIATDDTYYKVLNPTKGLSIDPVGLSFILPRMGIENYNYRVQANAMIASYLITMTGYECNYMDLVDTGIASHGSVHADPRDVLHTIENYLQHCPPYDQQTIILDKQRQYDEIPVYDYHAAFRNVGVAEIVSAATSFAANYQDDILHSNEPDKYLFKFSNDPSLKPNALPDSMDRDPPLLNICELYKDTVFAPNDNVSSVSDMYDRLEQIAHEDPTIHDVDMNGNIMNRVVIAKEIIQEMKSRSPLSLCVIYKLLQLGNVRKSTNTFQECCSRERIAQTNMYQHVDFETYAKYITSNPPNTPIPYENNNFWKHKSFRDVTNDEVLEILQANDDE